MARIKKTGLQDTESAPVQTIAKEKRTEVTVAWSGGSRTYTQDIHGDDFEDLAKGFSTKMGGTLV